MKYLFLFLILVLNYQEEKPRTQLMLTLDYPKGDTFRMKIHPLAGNDLYIERVFDSGNYCIEKIYRHGEVKSITEWWYKGNCQIQRYRETFYEENEIVERRWRNDSIYSFGLKDFPINDSISFEILYYTNGQIASCGLKNNLCYCSDVYCFDSINRTYWTGMYTYNRTFDTVFSVDKMGEKTMKVYSICSKDSFGSWHKVNAVGRIIDEIKPKF